MKNDKLIKNTFLVYAASCFACLMVFWLLLGDEGPLGYLFVEFALLGLVPLVLTLINSIVRGVSVFKSLLLPLFHGLGALICSFLTWNLFWFTNGAGNEYLTYIQWDRFFFGFVPSIVGLVIGLVIYGIRKIVENRKNV